MAALTLPPPGVLPPEYEAPPPFSPQLEEFSLPGYARNAAADERILSSQPIAPPRTRRPIQPADYTFESNWLVLNMGPKTLPVKVPCYGRAGNVHGYIQVKDWEKAKATKITVTLESYITTSVMERGMVMYTSSKDLVRESQVLYKAPDSSQADRLEFTFTLPTHVGGSTVPLPPSYTTNLAASMTCGSYFFLRVEMHRKGLRRHDSLKTLILHIPKTIPPDVSGAEPDATSRDPNAPVEWTTIELAPKTIYSKEKKNESTEMEVDPKDRLQVMIPSPQNYVSASLIPFKLHVPLNSPILSHIYTNLSISIVRRTVLYCGNSFAVRDGIIGTAEIQSVEDEPGIEAASPSGSTEGRRVFKGSVESFRDGGESTWSVPGVISMKYLLRIRIEPSSGDSKLLPKYNHEEVITMYTHPRIPDDQTLGDPVVGRIVIPGCEGASIRISQI